MAYGLVFHLITDPFSYKEQQYISPWVSYPYMNDSMAADACATIGASLSTHSMLYDGYLDGMDCCSCGWLSGM